MDCHPVPFVHSFALMKTRRTFACALCLFAAAAFFSVVWASPPAQSPPESAQAALSEADVVFLGRVVKVFRDRYGYESIAEVEVQKAWKGQKLLSRFVRVDGAGGPTYPARIFKLGGIYLFYLDTPKNMGAFRADSYLNRVLQKNEAANDIAFLSKTR